MMIIIAESIKESRLSYLPSELASRSCTEPRLPPESVVSAEHYLGAHNGEAGDTVNNPLSPIDGYDDILSDVVDLLNRARSAAARNLNVLMTSTYWQIGQRIVEDDQAGQERAGYGEAHMQRLAEDLTRQFGRGFSVRNLWQMRQFYLAWPQPKIPQTASAESPAELPARRTSVSPPQLGNLPAPTFPLPWSAYVRLLAVKDPDARRFYETEALRNGWTVRQLDRQINSMFYERTALSQDKKAMLERGRDVTADPEQPQDAIKEPFVLEFLGLKDEYSESDL